MPLNAAGNVWLTDEEIANALTVASPCTRAGKPVWYEHTTPSGIEIEFHLLTRGQPIGRYGCPADYREACDRYTQTIFDLMSAGF